MHGPSPRSLCSTPSLTIPLSNIMFENQNVSLFMVTKQYTNNWPEMHENAENYAEALLKIMMNKKNSIDTNQSLSH